MGGLLALIFAALDQEKVKNLVLLATPVDFDKAHIIKKWTSAEYFEVDRILHLWGNVSAEIVSWSLQMVKPVSSRLRGVNLLQYAANREDFAALLALEIWLGDAAPLPAELFRTIIKQLYRRNLLIRNKFKAGEKRIDLGKINCPVLNVVGTHDQVAVPESSLHLLELLKSADKQTLALDYGHLTIAVGSGAKDDFWYKSVEWLAARS
jgi:polyhydroxyalkanoate synthase